jgi:hypothetical protein
MATFRAKFFVQLVRPNAGPSFPPSRDFVQVIVLPFQVEGATGNLLEDPNLDPSDARCEQIASMLCVTVLQRAGCNAALDGELPPGHCLDTSDQWSNEPRHCKNMLALDDANPPAPRRVNYYVGAVQTHALFGVTVYWS